MQDTEIAAIGQLQLKQMEDFKNINLYFDEQNRIF